MTRRSTPQACRPAPNTAPNVVRALRVAPPLVIAAFASILALAGCSSAEPRQPSFPAISGLRLETVASDLQNPVHLAAPAGDDRLFIVEQVGRVRVVENGQLLRLPFLDIAPLVSYGGERGLLSIAFHPRYAQNGWFFVNYTDRNGDTQVVRYMVSADRNVANPASAKSILMVRQPYSNHNGGHVLFGPDGMFYIGMGDGGGAGDTQNNGQSLGTLLGKLLRIDVDSGDPYGIPPDNPFVGRAGARPEIWALGLRNPWRIAFDPPSGLILIADVGQNRYEEIDAAPARQGGLDYGWRLMEGNHCFKPARDCDPSGLVRPVVEYSHSQGCSVTGGVVYRGTRVPALIGHYVYADYCSGWIRSFKIEGTQVTEHREWQMDQHIPISSFGMDGGGELYVIDHDGRVLRVVGSE
jgi:glucose/arabinose dehydrogenase